MAGRGSQTAERDNGVEMLQYLLTGLAGIALGIVAMRIWQARETTVAADVAAPTPTDGAQPGVQGKPPLSRNLLIGAGVLALLAVAVLVFRPNASSSGGGSPTMGVAQTGDKPLDDVDTMINKLAARLEKEPGDGEGFRMLGWSYVMTGRPERAVEPYKRALALLPESALVHSGYGEALVGANKGTVSDEAKAEFDRAAAIDKTEPRAEYFLALWQAQHGQQKEALERWIALANKAPADASWQGELRRQIADTAGKLGVDVSGRLKAGAAIASSAPVGGPAQNPAAAQAISALPAAQQQASIDSMVDGLAAKLQANPKDVDRWIMLLRSRMVLKQTDRAKSDLVTARKALAGDATGLARVDAAAKELGVPGA